MYVCMYSATRSLVVEQKANWSCARYRASNTNDTKRNEEAEEWSLDLGCFDCVALCCVYCIGIVHRIVHCNAPVLRLFILECLTE